MSDTAALSKEERLATERIRRLEQSLIARKNWYSVFGVLCALIAVAVAATALWMLALIAAASGLICLLQYLDAIGSIREVRTRSTKRLVPDFSIFRSPPYESGSAKAASRDN
jgi:hypothetical protein